MRRGDRFSALDDEGKIKEILFYGKVLSNSLLCIRFEIEMEELQRLLKVYYDS